MIENIIKNLTIGAITLYPIVVMYGCQGEIKKSACPSQPVFALDDKKVKQITLSSQENSQSSMISGTESIGYKFAARKGQKFNYQVKNPNICTWLYSPDNRLLSNNILPQDGQYIFQVQNIQGAGTFDIVMSLGTENDIEISPSSIPPSPIVLSPTPSIPTIKPSNSVRPKNSPEKLITQYYQEINERDYQSAWNKLPITLQENREVHPQGYQSFVDFFNQLDRIQVKDVALVSKTKSIAQVTADISYVKNGNASPLFLRFYLKQDEIDRQWKIYKVKLGT